MTVSIVRPHKQVVVSLSNTKYMEPRQEIILPRALVVRPKLDEMFVEIQQERLAYVPDIFPLNTMSEVFLPQQGDSFP